MNVSPLLSNAFMALLCVIAVATIITLIQSIIYERNDERRRIGREQREIERHERRMK